MRHSTRLAILSLLAICLAFWAALTQPPLQAPAYQRPLEAYLEKVAPGSQVQVLQSDPLHLLVTTQGTRSQRLLLDIELHALLREIPENNLLVVQGRPPWRPNRQLLWLGALICAILPVAGLLRPKPHDQGARKVAIILTSYPPEFRAACLRLLKPNQVLAVNRALSQIAKVSYAERAKILIAFKVELVHAGSSSEHPEARLAAQILDRDYLCETPGPQPIPNYIPKGARRRRRIYACEHCDEVFIDPDSLDRHQLTHPPRRKPRLLAAAALILLAAATHFWPTPSTHLTLPEARPLSQNQQTVIKECEQLISGLLVMQTRDHLVLACAPADMPMLQSITNEFSRGHVLLRPLAPSPWRCLPAAELALALLLLAGPRRGRKLPLAAT